MGRTAPLTLLLAALWAAPAAAQATIASGMTPADVRAAFGDPARTRESDGWTYFFYANGCPRTCGSDDVVFFQGDRVVAAVLHSRARRFQGPGAARALDAVDPRPPAGAVTQATERGDDGEAVTTIRIRGESAPGQGMAPARVESVRVEGDRGPGGSVIVAPSPSDTAGLGRGDRPVTPGRQMRRAAPAEGAGTSPGSLDEGRIQRERTVAPRTIPAPQPGAAARDTALNQAQIDRERRVEPRTTTTPRQSAPAATRRAPATNRAPADTVRGDTTGITPPRVPPRE